MKTKDKARKNVVAVISEEGKAPKMHVRDPAALQEGIREFFAENAELIRAAQAYQLRRHYYH